MLIMMIQETKRDIIYQRKLKMNVQRPNTRAIPGDWYLFWPTLVFSGQYVNATDPKLLSNIWRDCAFKGQFYETFYLRFFLLCHPTWPSTVPPLDSIFYLCSRQVNFWQLHSLFNTEEGRVIRLCEIQFRLSKIFAAHETVPGKRISLVSDEVKRFL